MTLEAFLARKPVITATDAGGPLEFVVDGVNGAVAEPEPEAIGAAISAPARAIAPTRRRSATPATTAPPTVTWDGVIDQLVGA